MLKRPAIERGIFEFGFWFHPLLNSIRSLSIRCLFNRVSTSIGIDIIISFSSQLGNLPLPFFQL